MWRRTGAVAVFLLGALAPAIAEEVFTVDKSTAPGLAAKATIAKGKRIVIPEGSSVTLISGGGVQIVCVGAYDGPVEKCTGGATCSLVSKLLGKCGGADPSAGGVSAGGTRGIGIEAGGTRGGAR